MESARIVKKQRIKKYLLTKGNQLGIITVTVMITVKKEKQYSNINQKRKGEQNHGKMGMYSMRLHL